MSTGNIGSTSIGDPVPVIQELNLNDLIEMISYPVKAVIKVKFIH